MKKYLSIILAFVFMVLLVGCSDIDITDNESLVSETVVVKKTYKAQAIEQNATVEKLPEILSAEDKALKTEIANHIDTDVDFRHNKQETVEEKTFNITFSEIDSVPDNKRIIYKNELGDEFAYNIDNGKLRYAVMKSVVTEKTNESIDSKTARKIATKYVSTNCDINNYTMDQYKEIDSGHYFCYTRYIGGYPSNDRYSIQVGYDGSIVYVSNFTDTFNGKELSYDKTFIDSKIKEALSDKENINVDTVTIDLSDGKVCAICSYTCIDEYGNEIGGVNAIILLE